VLRGRPGSCPTTAVCCYLVCLLCVQTQKARLTHVYLGVCLHDFLSCHILCLQMGPGPNGVGMTLYNLTCGAWDLYNSVFTTQPAVAERLPFPEGAPQITAATKAGPLVQSVRDCNSLQVRTSSCMHRACFGLCGNSSMWCRWWLMHLAPCGCTATCWEHASYAASWRCPWLCCRCHICLGLVGAQRPSVQHSCVVAA
jgi:hypothetical protein